MLGDVSRRLGAMAIHLTWSEEAISALATQGYDPKYGARPLRRLIQRAVEDALSEALLAGRIATGDDVRLLYQDEKFSVQRVNLLTE